MAAAVRPSPHADSGVSGFGTGGSDATPGAAIEGALPAGRHGSRRPGAAARLRAAARAGQARGERLRSATLDAMLGGGGTLARFA